MTIDTHDMMSVLYLDDVRSLDEEDRVTIWAHVQALVRDMGADARGHRQQDMANVAPTLDFAAMTPEIRALFRIALEQMPSSQDLLTDEQLDCVMCAEPLATPFAVRSEPHGLSVRYHEMNITI